MDTCVNKTNQRNHTSLIALKTLVAWLTDGDDFEADVQLDPDAVGGVHGFFAGETEREAGPIAKAQAVAAGLGLKARGHQRIFGQERHDFEIRPPGSCGELARRASVAGDPCQHFRKIDARHAGRFYNLGGRIATRFFENISQQSRGVEDGHSRSASRRRSAMNSSTTLCGRLRS